MRVFMSVEVRRPQARIDDSLHLRAQLAVYVKFTRSSTRMSSFQLPGRLRPDSSERPWIRTR